MVVFCLSAWQCGDEAVYWCMGQEIHVYDLWLVEWLFVCCVESIPGMLVWYDDTVLVECAGMLVELE